MFYYAAAMTFLFPLGVPIVLGFVLRRHRRALYPQNQGYIIRVTFAAPCIIAVVENRIPVCRRADLSDRVQVLAKTLCQMSSLAQPTSSGTIGRTRSANGAGTAPSSWLGPNGFRAGGSLAIAESFVSPWEAKPGPGDVSLQVEQEPMYHYVLPPATCAAARSAVSSFAWKWHREFYSSEEDERLRNNNLTVEHLQFLYQVNMTHFMPPTPGPRVFFSSIRLVHPVCVPCRATSLSSFSLRWYCSCTSC
jgi:hypothetical protein